MKNQIWYGLLGSKELLNQSCKNLHSTIVLELDGEVIKLPRLQGIVILNIASYMGGTNFVRRQRVTETETKKEDTHRLILPWGD